MPESVCVTRVIPQPGIDLLKEHFTVHVNEGDTPLSHDELAKAASSHDALVTLLTDRVDSSVMEAGKGRVRIIANVAVGYDNIDVQAADERGIIITNTPGILTDTTADFAWALLMAAGRRVTEGDRFLRAGHFHGWGIMMLLGGDVHGKTLGLVGFGRIGQAMARRARGFDMTVLYFDPAITHPDAARDAGAERVTLNELFRLSDFVSVHTPLTPETHHVIDSDALAAMKSSAYLINTSRGPVVDEPALAQALRTGVIAGAALDVFEREPEVDSQLLELENVLLTPHIASATVETRTRMATMAAENVIAVLSGGSAPNAVRP